MTPKAEQYGLVKQFLVACGSSLAPWFRDAKLDDAMLVASLIEEESKEYSSSVNPVDELDALVDLAYVAYNGLILLGLPTEPAIVIPSVPNQAGLAIQVLRYVRPLCEDRCRKELNALIDCCAITARHHGYDFNGAFHAVHAANMTKFWDRVELANITPEHKYAEARGTTKYVVRRAADGKIIKPTSFKAPELSAFLGGAASSRRAR
jgi:predicted HAD superfamily Cof-like phosphohydrolase